MIELGIVGAKNSGKTTLIEALLPEFTEQGLRVATLKHTGHNHTFDSEGKDSYRHRRAGAELTVALSQKEIALFAEPNEEFLEFIRGLMAKHFDLCLVEGNKQSGRPKALLTRNLKSLRSPAPDNIVASYGPEQFSADVTHFPVENFNELAAYLAERFSLGKAREAGDV
ncbi:MAG: molybdopterin-guanine dinucleotide biosynthesis protein B [Candidatus Zixiibacteriota bacterium]